MYETIKNERAILVVAKERSESWTKEMLLKEFEALVVSAGIEILDSIFINLAIPNPRFYIGKGKVEDISTLIEKTSASVVIFDNNLKFTQQRNLEEVFGIKTVDRTQLILDIFAKHAQTQEGILQVEFAQLEYLLPRLRGKGIILSRLGGGIGTRGPGEKKLEVDKRRIAERIKHLKKDLILVKQHRNVMRKKRKKEGVGTCSLVGYTNAGKTTLFNILSSCSQNTSASLFTTLDTVSRSISLHSKLKIILSDTVGFIYKLPPNLIEAFKATLEELHYGDILLHVIDANNENIVHIKRSVDSTLKELGLDAKSIFLVFNKIDKISKGDINSLKIDYPQAIFISALSGQGLKELKEKIYKDIFANQLEVVVKVPFDKMKLVNYLHDNCEILKTAYRGQEAVYWIKIEDEKLAYLQKNGLEIKKI